MYILLKIRLDALNFSETKEFSVNFFIQFLEGIKNLLVIYYSEGIVVN